MNGSAPTGAEAFLRACLCLRRDGSASARDAVDVGAHAWDGHWAALERVVEAERVGPLMHHTLRAAGIGLPLAEALQQSYHLTALRNLLLLRELGACLRELAAAGVPVIVLKGAALIETVYDNPSLRPMGDADLLVARHDLATAQRALTGLGYTLASLETHPGAVSEYENELTFRKPGRQDTWIDVHWSLFDSPYYQGRVTMDWFWDTARPASIADVPSQVLGPEALLLHLCGHLTLHHQATGLLWWNDIAEVLERERDAIDWPALLSRTCEYGLLLPLRTVLARVATEWQAPVPPAVLEALHAQSASPTEQRVFEELNAGQRTARDRFLSDLNSMAGWRQRLRFARTSLFPSPSYMRRRYRIRHPLWLPFYYPYRWLRGLLGLG